MEDAVSAPKPQLKETSTDNGEFKDQNPSKNPKAAELYLQKNINIINVVEDFNKTLSAIGAPRDINEEVQAYLHLVGTQSLKEKPSPRLIRSNLKNAAGILDEYITETLNKPSKVVTDWIDALLLQNINYKSDKPIIAEPSFIAPQEQAPPPEPEVLISDNQRLKELYDEAGKLIDIGKFRKALVSYDNILPEIQKAGDKDLETRIHMDKAYIYDTNKDYNNALDNYNKASRLSLETGNDNIHALAHYNMASIYDEFGKIDLALAHYYEALSFDGQAENLKAQTHTLNDVGNVLSSTRQYKQALNHYQVGVSLANETDDTEGKGYLFSNIAGVFKDIGQDQKALKYYKKAIECDVKIGNTEGYAVNYAYSADIMNRNNFPEKAEKLYKKSLAAAQKLGDSDLSVRILEKMSLF